ncbi:MAG: helix-turn-helix domain-containing protein [Thermincolia bacterium]
MRFGDRLREMRELRKLTQEELGEILSVSDATINRYEKEKRLPDIEMLQRLATYFSVTVDWLLGRSSNPEPSLTDDIPPEGLMYFRKLKNLPPEAQKQFMEAFKSHTKLIEQWEKDNDEK